MALRERLAFETAIESDTAALADLVFALLDGGIDIHRYARPDARRAGERASRDR